MLFRDLGIALSQPATTSGIDQRPSLVASRILEGRTPGAASQRLRLFAGAGDGVHLGTDRFGIAGRAAESCFDHHRAGGYFAVAIGVAEFLRRPFDHLACAERELRREKDIADLPAVGSAIHPDEAADCSRDAAQEL